MHTLRVALAQLNLTVGDLGGNRKRVLEGIRRAQAWQADLVVFPELTTTGYPPEDLLLKPQFIQDNLRVLRDVQGAAKGIVALVGFVDRDPQGRLYNAAAVLSGGRRVATYHKQCLPNYGVFDEPRYFTAGNRPIAITIGGGRVGILICEDLWERAPARQLSAGGCGLIVNLSASPYHAGKLGERQRLFARRARANRAAVVHCNLVGGQDELVFDGASLILDATGRLVAHGAQFQEDFVVADLRIRGTASQASRRGPRALGRPQRPRPRLPASGRVRLKPHEEIYEALRLGVRDYVRKNDFHTVVLGISGGIDSSLTACLAVDALGKDQVVGVVMPSRYSSAATQEDAKGLAKALGIRCEEISIEPSFKAYLATLQGVFGNRPSGVTEQNLQARVRGNLLMALSNTFGWLVLTTGNKSEMATGYCTLYGDMAGGFAVLKDVPKTLVYALARWRNTRGLDRPIPTRIFRRPPTAELAPHQTDQQTLPPYALLDAILQAYVEGDVPSREISQRNHLNPRVVTRVIQMVDRAEYKRRQGPPGIKITPKAFGKDRRMPITNRYGQGLS